MPNYTLHPPDGLNIHGTPYTVAEATTLRAILTENMGDMDFAACVYDSASPTNKVFDVHGVYDEVHGSYTHIYEKPAEVDPWDASGGEHDLIGDSADTYNYYGVDQSEYTISGKWDYNDIDFDEF